MEGRVWKLPPENSEALRADGTKGRWARQCPVRPTSHDRFISSPFRVSTPFESPLPIIRLPAHANSRQLTPTCNQTRSAKEKGFHVYGT